MPRRVWRGKPGGPTSGYRSRSAHGKGWSWLAVDRGSVWIVRPATEADAGAILEVAHNGWRDTYHKVLSPAAIEDVLSRWYSQDSFRRRLRGLDVVERGGRVAGYVQHGASGEGVHEVFAIYIDPSMRGLGAGWALWQEVHRAASVTGRQRIELWMLEDNAIGRQWYDRQGGTVVGSQLIRFLDGDKTELRYRFAVELPEERTRTGTDPNSRR